MTLVVSGHRSAGEMCASPWGLAAGRQPIAGAAIISFTLHVTLLESRLSSSGNQPGQSALAADFIPSFAILAASVKYDAYPG